MGQLGDGTTINSTGPVTVKGLATGVVAVASGYYHSCALTVAGAVKCWGLNTSGELGNGTNTTSSSPVPVVGLASGVTAISVGYDHSCAVVSGAAECWGNDGDGELGDGSTTNSNTPVAASGLGSGVTAIAAGWYHSCAVVSGGAQCWGSNGHGQLGNGSNTDSHVPVAAFGPGSGVSAITGGVFHTCAVVSGGAECWGYNQVNRSAQGLGDLRPEPVARGQPQRPEEDQGEGIGGAKLNVPRTGSTSLPAPCLPVSSLALPLRPENAASRGRLAAALRQRAT